MRMENCGEGNNGREVCEDRVNEIINKIFRDAKGIKRDKSNIFYLYLYNPCYGGANPYFDEKSKLILDVKNREQEAIHYFTGKLMDCLSETFEFTVCVMPSSRKGTRPSGIRTIAGSLCCSRIIDGTDCILRTENVPKKHLGGKRDVEAEIGSLCVRNENKIRSKTILLLDDVTTSGATFEAGTYLLKKAGAGDVIALALSKTII